MSTPYNRPMAETLLSIHEAASISGKSVQTIRRAIKARKIQVKRRKTPQGFNYLVTQDSLKNYYKLQANLFEREQGSIKSHAPESRSKAVPTDFVTHEDLKSLQQNIEQLLDEYKKEKDNFMRFAKAFQDRFVVLENQLKLIEEPRKKSWFQFWK